MENEGYSKLSSRSTYGAMSKSFTTIKKILENFNSFHTNDEGIENGQFQKKITILNCGLMSPGYSEIDMTYGNSRYGYNQETAEQNRIKSLSNLNPAEYVGTILLKGTAKMPTDKRSHLFLKN